MVALPVNGILGQFVKTRGSRIYAIISLFVVTAGLVALAVISPRSSSPTWIDRRPFKLSQVHEPCEGHRDYASGESHTIPNIVHYIWLLKDPAHLRFGFRVFVSIYSTHLFLSPDAIYIHTDADPAVFEAARHSAHDVWTARTLAIPGITPKYVVRPERTSHGVPVEFIEHKTDFLRIEALREMGGLYLDADAIPLRDMGPLRRSGFANVLGYQPGLVYRSQGFVNNGVMMARPRSLLMNVWYAASHRFFTGGWDTASTLLLTDLSQRLAAVPSEVLLLPPHAFSPISFEAEDQARLYVPRLKALPVGQPRPTAHNNTCASAMAWAVQRESSHSKRDFPSRANEFDFSDSYVLHAFDRALIPDWYGNIDLAYVMARRSNYARAVYPAIWHAIQAGIIPEAEKYL